MNILKTALAAGLFAVVGSVANAAQFGFYDPVVEGEQSALDEALAALSMEVTESPAGTINFVISSSEANAANGTDPFFVSQVLFDFGGLSPTPLTDLTPIDTADVDFNRDDTISDSFAGFNSPAVSFSMDTAADAANGCGNCWAINRGESLTIQLTLTTPPYTLNDIIGYLNDGTIRVGLRIQNLNDGPNDGSDGFINGECTGFDCPDDRTEIPLPAAGWLLIGSVGVLTAMKRRQKAA